MNLDEIDSARLPEPLRQKLQARLEQMPAELRARLLDSLGKLPPGMLEKLLEHGSPMLDRLLDRLEQKLPVSSPESATSILKAKPNSFLAPNAPSGHYNQTVQRGDSLSLRTLVVVLILIGIVFLLYRSGILAG